MRILLLLSVTLAGVYASQGVFHGKWSSEREGFTLYPPFDPVKPEYDIVNVIPPDTTPKTTSGVLKKETTQANWQQATEATTRQGPVTRSQTKNAITSAPQNDEPLNRNNNIEKKSLSNNSSNKKQSNGRTYNTPAPSGFPPAKNESVPSIEGRYNEQDLGVTSNPVTVRPENPQDHADEFDLRFSKTFFRLNTQKKNVILSPVSVRILLAILGEASLRNGKRDQVSATTRQLIDLAPKLSGPADFDSARENIKASIDSLKVPSNLYDIGFGTRIYTLQRIRPSDSLKNTALDTYDAAFYEISKEKPENTVNEINDWVRNITNNKIKKLVQVAGVRSSVVMLLNAIYFKGLWQHPFNKTIDLKFHTGNGTIERKQFVQQVDTFKYAYDPNRKLRIVQMPYEGNKFSMFVILPFENDGLDQIISNLSSKGFDEIIADMEDTVVNITLPKFSFDSKVNLNNVIKELGVTEIFTDAAEFPQFTSEGGASKIKVSSIIQKSGIVVDEKGSEAQAATEIELVDKFGGDPRQFIVDHPFMFFIQDDKTNAKLFSGVVYDPVY